MLHLLQRHPLPIKAFFKSSLVLTYAFPQEILAPLLPPGLDLYMHGKWGFLAIALVQTKSLRPSFLPSFAGCDFFLAGYRIFANYRTPSGRNLKGLRILRSYTDRRLMVFGGNLLTHYAYRVARVDATRDEQRLSIKMSTADGHGDLDVSADLGSMPAPLPVDSPFADFHEARKFAGPLPFTFDYEKETHSMVLIEGVRQHWHPQPVQVEVRKANFLHQPPFHQFPNPPLANAFYVENIPYRWKRGVVYKLEPDAA